MSYKHQAESYRIIDGVRWESWGDFNESEALSEARSLIGWGWRVRRVQIGEGMVRIFRRKSDEA